VGCREARALGSPVSQGHLSVCQICNIELRGIPGRLYLCWCLWTSGRCMREWVFLSFALLPAEEGIAPNMLTTYLFKAHAGEVDSFFLVTFPLHSAVAGRVVAVHDGG